MRVIKIGGSCVGHPQVASHLARAVRQYPDVIVVHGGSDLTNSLCERLGMEVRFITSPSGFSGRHTDPAMLDIFAMTVAGKINTELVAALQREGVNACGLSGVDARLLVATRKNAIRAVTPDGTTRIIRDDYSGKIETVNAPFLRQLLHDGYTPVMAPLALGQNGERLNVDADRAAASIAAAMTASTLAFVTDIAGVLKDVSDADSLITSVAADDIGDAMQWARSGMRKKLLAAQEAIAGGVARVVIGQLPLEELLDGQGTCIQSERNASVVAP